MKHLTLCAVALFLGFALSACERETRVVEKGGTTIVQPKGPAGPAGPQGPKGEPGKPGGDTTVNVNPPESKKEEPKKE